MGAVNDTLEFIILLGWFALGGFLAYKIWKVNRRINKILDEFEEDIKK